MAGNLAEIDFGLDKDQKLRLGILAASYVFADHGVDPLRVANIIHEWVKTGNGSLEGLVNGKNSARELPALISAAFNRDDDDDDDEAPGLTN